MNGNLRLLSRAAAFAVVCGLAATGAQAQTGLEVAPGGSKNICLRAHMVENTEIVDANTILFHMTNGKTWKNTLSHPCSTISREDGIVYSPTNDKLCSNLETFRDLQTGESCFLGEFTPYQRPPK